MTDAQIQREELIALVDMDGTLCDYEGAINRDMKSMCAPDEKVYCHMSDDLPPHILARLSLIKRQPGWWSSLGKIDYGFDILRELMRMDFSIHILTKGPSSKPEAWKEKVEWVRDNLPPNIPITVTSNKGLVYGKVLVDDFPPYVLSWLEWRKRGLVVMPSHKINSGFSHPQVVKYDGSNIAEVIDRLAEVRNRNA